MLLDQRAIVSGLLLHLGGLDKADADTKSRCIESINPVNAHIGVWQANDNLRGLSWIVALGHEEIEYLIATRNDGQTWAQYKPSLSAQISEFDGDHIINVVATVATFHDTRHGACPPALLRIGENYIYRNASGHAVPLDTDSIVDIMEYNKLPL